MINPISDFHFWINFGFTINSIICAGFIAYSFKKRANLQIILIPVILITTRSGIRLLDYENTMYDPNSSIANETGRRLFILF